MEGAANIIELRGELEPGEVAMGHGDNGQQTADDLVLLLRVELLEYLLENEAESLATVSGVSISAISRFKVGKAAPSLRNVLALVSALKLKLAVLVRRAESMTNVRRRQVEEHIRELLSVE